MPTFFFSPLIRDSKCQSHSTLIPIGEGEGEVATLFFYFLAVGNRIFGSLDLGSFVTDPR